MKSESDSTHGSLHGRRAFITGASGHLGREFAHTLARRGCDLFLIDRNAVELYELVEGLNLEFGVSVNFECLDLEDFKSLHKVATSVANDSEPLNIIVNNAAFVGDSNLDGWTSDFQGQTVETFRRAVEVNLTVPFGLSQILYPKLSVSEGANIVNISSIYGFLGPNNSLYSGTSLGNPAAYAASKGGLLQLTRWMATSLAPKVRVNAISPGGIQRSQPQEFINRYEALTPLARMGRENDVCGALEFLTSDQASYVTGQNLIVDGGWSTW